MRLILIASLVLALAACGERQNSAEAGCARVGMGNAPFSDPGANDNVTAHSFGPTCAQAVLVLTIRNAADDPIWTFATTYQNLKAGPGGDLADVSPEEMEQFLSQWADLTRASTNSMPAWPDNSDTLGVIDGLAFHTDYDRESYEALRAQDLPRVCYAASYDSSQCLVIDPATREPAVIVSFGS